MNDRINASNAIAFAEAHLKLQEARQAHRETEYRLEQAKTAFADAEAALTGRTRERIVPSVNGETLPN